MLQKEERRICFVRKRFKPNKRSGFFPSDGGEGEWVGVIERGG